MSNRHELRCELMNYLYRIDTKKTVSEGDAYTSGADNIPAGVLVVVSVHEEQDHECLKCPTEDNIHTPDYLVRRRFITEWEDIERQNDDEGETQ